MRNSALLRVCPLLVYALAPLFAASPFANVCLAATSAESLLTSQTPAVANQSDGRRADHELGTRFSSTVAGQIAGIRFWKASRESGTHVGRIWDSRGRLLTSVVFANESASGWQTQVLPSPLAISANIVYTVSVNTGNTYYVETIYGMSSAIASGDLRSVAGSDGVYGSPGRFPSRSWRSTNYFRDVVFVPSSGSSSGNLRGTISVSSGSFAFGSVAAGSSSSQTLVLSNTGKGNTSVSSVTTTGTAFSVSGATFPVALAPGQAFSVRLAFAPTASGAFSGGVTVMSDATNSPLTLGLSGTGAVTLAPQISVVPSSVGFGSVSVGVTNTQTITVSNPGSGSLTVSQALITGSGLKIQGLATPATVVPGKSASFNVAFTPTAGGSVTGSLTLVTNAANSPLVVPISGSGVASVLQLSVNPTSLSFGSVTVGSSASQTVSIKNTGNAGVTLSALALSGSGNFKIGGISLPVTLSASQSTSFDVTFTAAGSGNSVGSIAIVSSANTAPVPISLTGTGAAAAAHTVQLSWSDSASSDIVGYEVYRGTISGGQSAAPLNSAPVAGTSFTDTSVQSGSTYYYVVTAVNAAGAESSPSNQVSATIP
jgi:Domain of unknown function (DUF4082)/Abnormal spindle-like microcephaly-assoc'd, ASPM-SPD-2-Hydin/HYDIN/CFA65/VesB-like, Ig-like domain/Cep192 domain 4